MAKDILRVKVEFDKSMAKEVLQDFIREEYGMTLEDLADLVQAKADGRCVVLPCKLGDTVYQIQWDGSITAHRVGNISVEEWGFSFEFYVDGFGVYRTGPNEKVFFTKEAAEEKVKELQKNGNL